MLSKSTIQLVRSLQQKKFRDEHGLFFAEGAKSINDMINWGAVPQVIYSTQAASHTNTEHVDAAEMQKISALKTPTTMLAIFEQPTIAKRTIAPKGHALLLDGVQDPGNVGTIIRTAHWFGITTIVCSPTTADVYQPKVVQATMGSIAAMQVVKKDLTTYIDEQQHIPALCTSLHGQQLHTLQAPSQAIIVLGSEGSGVSSEVGDRCLHHIKIAGAGTIDSLNVGIAAGIVCHWLCV